MPKLNIPLIFRYKLAMKGNHMPRMHSCLIFFLTKRNDGEAITCQEGTSVN